MQTETLTNTLSDLISRWEKSGEELIKFLASFAEEGEGTSIIMGTLILDKHLKFLLRKVLIKENSKTNLFDNDKPLSAFSAKIILAHRLGLIDEEFKIALNTVGKLRNNFAHLSKSINQNTWNNSDDISTLTNLSGNNTFYNLLKEKLKNSRFSGELVEFIVITITMIVAIKTTISIVEYNQPIHCASFAFIPED